MWFQSQKPKTPQFLVIDFVTFHSIQRSFCCCCAVHMWRNLNVIKSRITLSIKHQCQKPQTPLWAISIIDINRSILCTLLCVCFIVNLCVRLCCAIHATISPVFFSDTEKLPWEKRRNILSVTLTIWLFRSCNWSCLCSFHLIGTPLWYYSPMKKLQAFGSNASFSLNNNNYSTYIKVYWPGEKIPEEMVVWLMRSLVWEKKSAPESIYIKINALKNRAHYYHRRKKGKGKSNFHPDLKLKLA